MQIKAESLNEVERFLLHLEEAERIIFGEHPDYVLLPIVPFFQLVHVLNVEEVIRHLFAIELATGGVLVRDEGYLAVAMDEGHLREATLSEMGLKLISMMRF